ncbi:MAG: DMT family transporter [Oscillospiraceae bacterium]|nr:DMT family transporter [Oscillospiraceae bacterium]
MKNKSMLGNILLTLTALIWGCAFVAQSVGMEYVEPITFNGIRCIIGGIVLIIANIVFDNLKKKNGTYQKPEKSEQKELIKGGIICGIIIFFASTIQQIGISQTTVGKAGFISVLYILIVPFIGLLLKQKLPKMIWICCALAVAGLYLLCMNESLSMSNGDLIVLLSAVAYAVHILAIGHFAPKVDCVKLSCLQFLVCGAISVVVMLIFEKPDFSAILSAWLPILYAGALSGGVGYTLQTVAQKWTKPSVASLLMSLESVFAVLAGAIILHQVPTLREAAGCILMFISIIIIQIPEKKKGGEI